LSLPGEGDVVRIEAESQSATAFDRMEVLHNGEVIAATDAGGERPAARIEAEAHLTTSGWLAARCLAEDGAIRAHTSPVYVQLEGSPLRPSADRRAPLMALLDQTLAEAKREHLRETLQAVRQELLQRGE